MPSKPPVSKHLLTLAFGSPLFIVYGGITLIRGVRRAAHAVRGFRAGLAHELTCPNGHPNAVTGRWECTSCKAIYMGWVGRCALCGVGCSWFPCETCGVSIKVPWERG